MSAGGVYGVSYAVSVVVLLLLLLLSLSFSMSRVVQRSFVSDEICWPCTSVRVDLLLLLVLVVVDEGVFDFLSVCSNDSGDTQCDRVIVDDDAECGVPQQRGQARLLYIECSIGERGCAFARR